MVASTRDGQWLRGAMQFGHLAEVHAADSTPATPDASLVNGFVEAPPLLERIEVAGVSIKLPHQSSPCLFCIIIYTVNVSYHIITTSSHTVAMSLNIPLIASHFTRMITMSSDVITVSHHMTPISMHTTAVSILNNSRVIMKYART